MRKGELFDDIMNMHCRQDCKLFAGCVLSCEGFKKDIDKRCPMRVILYKNRAVLLFG